MANGTVSLSTPLKTPASTKPPEEHKKVSKKPKGAEISQQPPALRPVEAKNTPIVSRGAQILLLVLSLK